MGNKGGKNKQPAAGKQPAGGYQPTFPPTPSQPANNLGELDNLAMQTGFSRAEVKNIYDQFVANNPDGKLDKREFVAFYSKVRAEPVDRLDEMCEFVFRAFDTDNNGYLTFSEFMVIITIDD